MARPTSPYGALLFGGFFSAFASIFIAIGAGLAIRQAQRLHT